jgi:hypothetical protein
VKSKHGDWDLRCETPPGAAKEQCALLQSVAATLRRVLVGFGLAALVGVPLGILAGAWHEAGLQLGRASDFAPDGKVQLIEGSAAEDVSGPRDASL